MLWRGAGAGRPGEPKWRQVEMTRRVRAIFVADIPGRQIAPASLEYYVWATDDDNQAVFPTSAPETPLSLVATNAGDSEAPGAIGRLEARGRSLQWSPADGDAFWYRIYRGDRPDFTPAAAALVTYVDKETTRFEDVAPGFEGMPLKGKMYYRVTAVDFAGNESPTSPVAGVDYGGKEPAHPER